MQPTETKKARWTRVTATVAVFAFAFAVSAYVQSQPAFRDPDAFYHAKMAALMLKSGIIREFPWLPYTAFSAHFADHHFLYHVLLMPFAAAFGPLSGLKVATALFYGVAIAAFYGLLRAYGVRRPWLYALLLASWSGFAYRGNLGKASILSAATVFLALVFLKKGMPRALAALSFAYVWLYGGWPLMFVVTAAHLLGASVAGKRTLTRDEYRLAAGAAAGLAAGVVVNPYFPRNLAFGWEQFVQIGVVGYKDVIAVGGEWYAPTAAMMLNGAGIAFVVVAWGAAAFFLNRRSRPALAVEARASLVTAGILAMTAFALMSRSYRYVEYFLPFALFFGALLVDASAPTRRDAKRNGFIVLCVLLGLLAVREIRGVRAVFDIGTPWTRYAATEEWLAANVPPGETLFHGGWEDFPPLFYRDDRLRYVVGLDPTFLYRRDPERYREWAAVGDGTAKDVTAAVRAFDSRYVLVRQDQEAMRRSVEAAGPFRLVHEDPDARIYELIVP